MKRILILSDAAGTPEPLAKLLQQEGFETITAASASEALRLMEVERPHLILLDMALSGAEAMKTLGELRAEASTRASQLLILTNHVDKESVIRAAQCGVRGILLKSTLAPADLVARINKIVSPRGVAAVAR